MRRHHVEAVLTIERLTSLAPWSDVGFIESIARHTARVYCVADQVRGFAVCRRIANSAELLNIAIHPSHHGSGCGDRLLRSIVYELPSEVVELTLEVRVSNFRAIRLYRSHGFKQIGERTGYYPTSDAYMREDALVMCRQL
mgnify:CR=1 FL=1